MADLTAIRNALAAAITSGTGLRALAQAHDSVTPPCAVILPGSPLITYGDTLDSLPVMTSVTAPGGAVGINLVVLLVMSDAPLVEQTQRALDSYLGVGDPGVSVPDAIEADQNLGGTVHWVQAMTAGRYGRLEYAGQTYFGAAVNCNIGAM